MGKKSKVGGLGQGLSDARARPESTGEQIGKLIEQGLLDSGDELRIMMVSTDRGASQNGVDGLKVRVTFELRSGKVERPVDDVRFNRTDEWFFARHLKLTNEEILNIMRSHLK